MTDIISENNNKTSRIFFGWWTVLVTGIVSGLGLGFYGYGLSIFFKDIAAELKISRAVTSIAAGIGRLEGGITSPLTGWLSDRYGPKWVVFTGILFASAGLALMYIIQSVTAYIATWGVIMGFGLNIGLTVAVDKSLNDWFIYKRGIAQGTKFGLIGFSGIVLIPVVTWLVSMYGWRLTCLIWGLLMFVCAPVTLFFVKQKKPEYYGLQPDGIPLSSVSMEETEESSLTVSINQSEDDEQEITFRRAIKTRAYCLMTFAYAIQVLVVGAMAIHMFPLLTDMGIELATASGMMSLMVFFTIPSRFFGGAISDHVKKSNLNLLLSLVFFTQATAFTIFLLFDGILPTYIMLVLFGMSSGSATPLLVVMIGRYFGRNAFGAIFGTSNAIRAPFALVAPVFAGWVYDRTGSYTYALVLFSVCSYLAAFVMLWAKPPKKRVGV